MIDYMDILPKPEDSELDMLDLASDYKSNSRLGCQIKLDKSLDGITFIVPDTFNDLH